MISTLPTLNRLPTPDLDWSYTEAFSRQRGLVSAAEQERLRNARVAIAGLGGVGGVHLATLARLGIGSFHIADPDSYELANFNRQHGATVETLGRSKAEVMAERARAINPEVRLRVFDQPITPANVARFLDGVDVLVDGIDFFALDARRLLFREARRRGLWAITAGPMNLSRKPKRSSHGFKPHCPRPIPRAGRWTLAARFHACPLSCLASRNPCGISMNCRTNGRPCAFMRQCAALPASAPKLCNGVALPFSLLCCSRAGRAPLSCISIPIGRNSMMAPVIRCCCSSCPRAR
jgi:hypothetical protein